MGEIKINDELSRVGLSVLRVCTCWSLQHTPI